jgi:hypothetical protein
MRPEAEDSFPPPFGTRHPVYAAAWARPSATMPPSALGWLAVGGSDVQSTAFAGPDHDPVQPLPPPSKLLAGYVDVAFVCVYVLPLVLIRLSYDLVASDRQDGILTLVLVNPIRLRRVLLAAYCCHSSPSPVLVPSSGRSQRSPETRRPSPAP